MMPTTLSQLNPVQDYFFLNYFWVPSLFFLLDKFLLKDKFFQAIVSTTMYAKPRKSTLKYQLGLVKGYKIPFKQVILLNSTLC